MHFTSREISEKYDRFARWYDLVEGVPDLLGVRKLRRRVLQRASGNVLEVAVGTGKNLRYYSPGCRIIAVDLSREMLDVARKRATNLSLDVSFLLRRLFLFPTGALIRLFRLLRRALFQILSLRCRRWPGSLSRPVEFCCWSTAAAIGRCSLGFKISTQIKLQSGSAVTGTESHTSSRSKQVLRSTPRRDSFWVSFT